MVNTWYATDSYVLYVLKMEYVYKINIFALKMMMKSGLEKIFLKFLHAQSLFSESLFYYWTCTFEHKSTFLWSKKDFLKKALRMVGFQK